MRSVGIVAALLAGSAIATGGSAPAAATGTTDAAAAATLPADFVQLVAEARAAFGVETPWSDAVEAAIDPDDYECSRDNDFSRWIDEVFGEIDPASLDLIFGVGADFWAFANSIAFDQDASDEYIGVDGQHTKELQKRHLKDQRFWDVPTNDVLLQGAHGSNLADDAKMVPVLQSFGFPEADAQFFVDLVQQVIIDDPALDFDHPLFTLNALAFGETEEGDLFPGSPFIPAKIVMGDGILEAYEDIGLGANAPDFIHAHEFAHQVQIELGVFDNQELGPEATRRTELMADAFAAYNLAHARGASFQTRRIVDIVSASYNIGDCGFDDPGHHGTPNQREAAAAWGAGLANSARPQGKIESATTMLELFDAQLPTLIAPDAG